MSLRLFDDAIGTYDGLDGSVYDGLVIAHLIGRKPRRAPQRAVPTEIVNVSLPHITGTLISGAQLRAELGEWTGTVHGFAVQWVSVGGESAQPIKGATGRLYTAAPADSGRSLMVRVTAIGPLGAVTADSNVTEPLDTPRARGVLTPTRPKTSALLEPHSRPRARGLLLAKA